MKKTKLFVSLFVLVFSFVAVGLNVAFSAGNSTFNQTINPGTIATDIRSNASTSVTTPAVSMSAKNFSFNCQSAGSASTGVFGTASERIYVDNPDSADGGWVLAIAATSGATATWNNGGATSKFDFNDASASGCGDGADSDSFPGQMTINPSVGSTVTDYSGTSVVGIGLGTSGSFAESTVDSITLVTAAAGSADIWRGYFTGFTISQTIPAEQPADAYSINLTLTVATS